MPVELAAKIAAALAAHEPRERDLFLLERLPRAAKMLEVYASWDGRPETLNTEAFEWDDYQVAIDELSEHYEAETGGSLQVDNAYSNILTARSLMQLLFELPPVRKKVVYV